MTKLKKVLSLLVSAALTASAIGSFTANAASHFVSDPLDVPETYIEYEDTEELFYWYLSSVRGQDRAYKVYYEDVDGKIIYHLYIYYKFNHTIFTVHEDKMDEFEAIYAEYSDALDMDYYRMETPAINLDVTTAEIYDDKDADGKETVDPSAMENKQELITELAEKLYDAGCISEAEYYGATASAAYGWHDGRMNVNLQLENSDEQADAITEIVSQFGDDVTAVYEESEPNGHFVVKVDLHRAADVMKAIKAVYPDAYGGMGVFQMSSNTVKGEAVNLLTAIIEEESCDINQSGAPDLDDAVLVLTSYANTAAGIETASETDTVSYDVNGDGAVDLDDAVKILTVYAELAAGLR